jgi:formamidase
MCGSILVRFALHKGEAPRCSIRFPRFQRNEYYFPPKLTATRRFLATTGMSVRDDGANESEGATSSVHNALLSMIDLLGEFKGANRYRVQSVIRTRRSRR